MSSAEMSSKTCSVGVSSTTKTSSRSSTKMQALMKKTIEAEIQIKKALEQKATKDIWDNAKEMANNGGFVCTLRIYDLKERQICLDILRKEGFRVKYPYEDAHTVQFSWELDEHKTVCSAKMQALQNRTIEMEIANKLRMEKQMCDYIWQKANEAADKGDYSCFLPLHLGELELCVRIARQEGFTIGFAQANNVEIKWEPRE